MAGETSMLRTMHVLRSENVNAPKRKLKHDGYSSFSKRESPIAPEYINLHSALRSPKAGEAECATKNVCSSF